MFLIKSRATLTDEKIVITMYNNTFLPWTGVPAASNVWCMSKNPVALTVKLRAFDSWDHTISDGWKWQLISSQLVYFVWNKIRTVPNEVIRRKKIREQRDHVLNELLMTERQYCRDLWLTAQVFRLEDEDYLKQKGVDSATLFGNLLEVMTIKGFNFSTDSYAL